MCKKTTKTVTLFVQLLEKVRKIEQMKAKIRKNTQNVQKRDFTMHKTCNILSAEFKERREFIWKYLKSLEKV